MSEVDQPRFRDRFSGVIVVASLCDFASSIVRDLRKVRRCLDWGIWIEGWRARFGRNEIIMVQPNRLALKSMFSDMFSDN